MIGKRLRQALGNVWQALLRFRWFRRAYVLYKRHSLPLTVLVFVLVIGLALPILFHPIGPLPPASTFRDEIASDPSRLATYVAIARDLMTVLAILLGGVWTYHLLIRRRILRPKLKLSSRVKHIASFGKGDRLVLVRCLFSNVGSVKITPLLTIVEVEYGYFSDGRLNYTPPEERRILQWLSDDGLLRTLEPGEETYDDIPIPLRVLSGSNGKDVVLLKLRIQLTDDRFMIWRQDTVLPLRPMDIR